MINEALHNPVLEAKDLSIGYGKGAKIKVISSNMQLLLYPGELVCLIGPNGAGKSTLLRTLSGVQKPLSGEVSINNKSLRSYSRDDLARQVSLVLTEKVQAGNLSAYELVALGRYPHTGWNDKLNEKDLQKINWAFEITGSLGLKDLKINEVSDGQLQKIMIARALAQDGNIMILDEPTAHLDIGNRMEIMHLLKDLAQETGKAILVSSHELDLALQTAGQLWLMPLHQPLVSGIPEELALKGSLSATFNTKNISFDASMGKFRISRKINKYIQVEGGGEALFWTKHALERTGFSHKETFQKLILNIEQKNNVLSWILKDAGDQYTFSSLASLLGHLKGYI